MKSSEFPYGIYGELPIPHSEIQFFHGEFPLFSW